MYHCESESGADFMEMKRTLMRFAYFTSHFAIIMVTLKERRKVIG